MADDPADERPLTYLQAQKTLVGDLEDKASTALGTSSFLDTSVRSELARKPVESYDPVEDALQAHVGATRSPTRAGRPNVSTSLLPPDVTSPATRTMSRAGSSAFASSTQRSSLARAATPATVAPGAYRVKTQWGSRQPLNLRRHRYRTKGSVPIEALVSGGGGGAAAAGPTSGSAPHAARFMGKEQRFKASRLETVDAVPGPGAYDPPTSTTAASPQARQLARGSAPAKQLRFSSDAHDYLKKKSAAISQSTVGPGSYDVSSPWVKRSYNARFV